MAQLKRFVVFGAGPALGLAAARRFGREGHAVTLVGRTAATVDAQTLHHFGSVHEVVPRAELDEAALRVARDIAAKDTRVIRAAKEALNFIDVQRVNHSYRMEQGFTFELNLAGVADEHRDAFAGTNKAGKGSK